jgi:two-component system nitrogen regulation sensor histidine kinase GlnL
MIYHIRQNAEEAIELIRTMRGPLEQASVAPLNVNQCLDKAIRSCWHPENVNLHVSYGARLPLVEANVARLEAVFQNVVSNAIQALNHEGGDIHIRTRRTNTGDAEIVISDNGPGIAPDIQAQLFTPGVSDREGRLGIGLWLVETFIRQFNGWIEWNSSPDRGTTFVITLPPATTEKASEGETPYAAAHEYPGC